MTHTKGPWSFSDETIREGLRSRLIHGMPEGMLAIVRVENQGAYYGEANARLIAAAPDLLEFVQQIFNGIDTGMITIDSPADETLANILSRGRKALSKATGAA